MTVIGNIEINIWIFTLITSVLSYAKLRMKRDQNSV